MKVRDLIKELLQFENDDEVKVSALVDFTSFDNDDIKNGYTFIDATVLEVNPDEDDCVLMVQDDNFKGGNYED